MTNQPIMPLSGPVAGTATLPGSKSLTNRALVCAMLSDSVTHLEGLLLSDDTAAMIEAARLLGAEIVVEENVPDGGTRAQVRGIRWSPADPIERDHPPLVIDARKAGTVARFLLPVLAARAGNYVLDGHAQLRGRPIGELVAALTGLGAEITETTLGESRRSGDGLPLAIRGASLSGGPIEVRANQSSQFLSGLLLVGPMLPGGLKIRMGDADGAVSQPYLDMTVAVMEAFGARVTRSLDASAQVFEVAPGGYMAAIAGDDLAEQQAPFTYRIEPDATAAGYFWAAAAITGGEVRTEGLGLDSLQGDVAFTKVLEEMGCEVSVEPAEITVRGPTGLDVLRGGEFNLSDISDNVQTLAVVAAFASTATNITGVGFIRAKEIDRIGLTVAELVKRGISATEHSDGLSINPEPALIRPGHVDAHDDHRMAMALSLLGLRVANVVIDGAQCVDKTFPEYFEVLGQLHALQPNTQGVIAIDGPAASGKSTVARSVAVGILGRSLDECYLDTGAMYRSVAWAVLHYGIDLADTEAVARLALGLNIKIAYEPCEHSDDEHVATGAAGAGAAAGANGAVAGVMTGPSARQTVRINGYEAGESIRLPEVDQVVSEVAALAEVRSELVSRQRQWVETHAPAVVEGRDIASVVLPRAALKIFLTATPDERARRRSRQRARPSDASTSAQHTDNEAAAISDRDARDTTRPESPLQVAANAIILDTTDLDTTDVVAQIGQLYRYRAVP